MKQLNNYIIEKLKLNNNIQVDSSNIDEIEDSLDKIFNDNKSFKQNKEEIFNLLEKSFKGKQYPEDNYKYVICMGDYNHNNKYLKKYKINKNLFHIISMEAIDDIFNKYFWPAECEREFNYKNEFFNFNSNFDYIFIRAKIERNRTDDKLDIYILSTKVLEDMDEL